MGGLDSPLAPCCLGDVVTVHDGLAQQVVGQGGLPDGGALNQPRTWRVGVCPHAFAEVLLRPGLDAVGQDSRITLKVGLHAEGGRVGQVPHVADQRIAATPAMLGTTS